MSSTPRSPGFAAGSRASTDVTEPRPEPRISVSGIQPSGNLHLGNFFGAVQQYLELAASGYRCYYFLANYHALTSVGTARAAGAHAQHGGRLPRHRPRSRALRPLSSERRPEVARARVDPDHRHPDGAPRAVPCLQGQGCSGPPLRPRPLRLSGPAGGRHPHRSRPLRPGRPGPEAAHRGDPGHRTEASTTPTARS